MKLFFFSCISLICSVQKENNIKIYLVGGAVRDILLGKKPIDKDFVVVGSSPEQMIQLGFLKVGKHFPVFLHPETKEEYALARKEIKSGKGHQGFTFEFNQQITLEEDLYRRDITINAIAMDEENSKTIIDPFNGAEDLKKKIIKHVSLSFRDDPLRVLRVARFAASLPDFSIQPETLKLMTEISFEGELKYLSSERVFFELEKALLSKAPQRFFDTLEESKAFAILFPELQELKENALWNHSLTILKIVITLSNKLDTRFASFLLPFGDQGLNSIKNFCKTIKAPNRLLKLSTKVAKYNLNLINIKGLKPEIILNMILSLNAIHDLDFLDDFICCCNASFISTDSKKNDFTQGKLLIECVDAIKNIDNSNITKQAKSNQQEPKDLIYQTRLSVIEKVLANA